MQQLLEEALSAVFVAIFVVNFSLSSLVRAFGWGDSVIIAPIGGSVVGCLLLIITKLAIPVPLLFILSCGTTLFLQCYLVDHIGDSIYDSITDNKTTYSSGTSSFHNIQTQKPKNGPGENEWKCVCGKINQMYTGTCSCGMRRSEAEKRRADAQLRAAQKANPSQAAAATGAAVASVNRNPAQNRTAATRPAASRPSSSQPAPTVNKANTPPAQEQPVNSVEYTQEKKMIDALKMYKELLDDGTITQEEFDAKKASILNKLNK
ncbi:MAG: SHOCT domain-containing protein [Clostridiales bacterium]|nr:SHOCT domain-containing protein [Clostridiales bacterium]